MSVWNISKEKEEETACMRKMTRQKIHIIQNEWKELGIRASKAFHLSGY